MLQGKKIGILLETDFYEPEIWYYASRFAEEGADVHFLTRLWGQDSITFEGHEFKAPFECRESFEDISDAALSEYAAVIVPAGMVADRLRYTEDINELPPATKFMQRIFADKNIVKGIICHGMWLLAPAPELVKGRRAVVHNNLLGDAKNMGINYVDEDVVVDDDLITARTGGHCNVFAKAIIEKISGSRGIDNIPVDTIYRHAEHLEKKEILPGVLGQYLGGGEKMNVMHWNFEDNVSLPEHSHPSEQFGYIIKGGFRTKIGDKEEILKAGDAYFVPSNHKHAFTSIGDTEAIDVFGPARSIPGFTKDNQEVTNNSNKGSGKMAKNVLVLATNYAVWAEELQAPWDALKKAGHNVTLATYLGKKPLPIKLSMDPDFVDGYQNVKVNMPEVVERTKELLASGQWDHPIKIGDAKIEDYDALVMTGGPGNPLDITNNPAVHRMISHCVKNDKLVGAVCYSVGALAFTRDPDNNYKSVIYGKTVTAHPRKWDFADFDLTYDLYGADEDNKGTDLMTPGFAIPLQDIVEDAVGPNGTCISDDMATREKPCVAYDWPFVTALSVESSIAYGEKLVEVLASR